MLNSEKIVIAGKDITVTEVKVKRVMALLPFLDDGKKEGDVQANFMDNVEGLLCDGCGLGVKDLEDMHSSELKILWAAFRKVNDFFFETMENLGLAEKIPELLSTLLSAYGGMFASLLSGVTPTVEGMDLAGLLGQSNPVEESAKTES